MATVCGYIERIKFRNEENGYSILSLAAEDDEYVLVGTFPFISEGDYIEAVGQTVEHPVYGQLTGPLDLSSRYDVSEFIRKVEEHAARPLSLLTDGIHLHTLRCPGEEAFRRARAALEGAGFLVR